MSLSRFSRATTDLLCDAAQSRTFCAQSVDAMAPVAQCLAASGLRELRLVLDGCEALTDEGARLLAAPQRPRLSGRGPRGASPPPRASPMAWLLAAQAVRQLILGP